MTSSSSLLLSPANCDTQCKMLNDDELVFIFSFLFDFQDLVHIQLVCKRWHQAVQLQWKLRPTLHFILHRSYDQLNRYVQFRPSVLSSILVRCCNLQRLTLSGLRLPLHHGLIKKVAQACPRLIDLNISQTLVSDQQLALIACRFKHLKAIDLRSCSKLSTKGLIKFFSTCTKLTHIRLNYTAAIKSDYIRYVNANVESIELENPFLFGNTNFRDFVVRSALTMRRLHFLSGPEQLSLGLTCINFLNLEYLELAQLKGQTSFLLLCRLRRLRSLIIEQLLEGDHKSDVLIQLAQSMPALRQLYIGSANSFTDESINQLPVLATQLRQLTLIGSKVTDVTLMAMMRSSAKLEYLNLSGNSTFSLNGLRSFLTNPPTNFQRFVVNCNDAHYKSIVSNVDEFLGLDNRRLLHVDHSIASNPIQTMDDQSFKRLLQLDYALCFQCAFVRSCHLVPDYFVNNQHKLHHHHHHHLIAKGSRFKSCF